MAINITDFDKIWASTSPLTPYAFSDANYQQGWNFVGSTPPARQMWDFLQKQNDEKTQWLYNNKLSNSTVETFSGSSTYSVSGYKYGRLCIVHFTLPSGYESGWHTTEVLITSNFPIVSTPVIVGNVSGQVDATKQIRLNVTGAGKLYGYVTDTLNNVVSCQIVYISNS